VLARGRSVKQGGLAPGRSRSARRAGGLRARALPAPSGVGRRGGRSPPSIAPPFLVRDLLALLDDEEIDQAGERIAKQDEVLLPVSRRVRERPHAVERDRQGRAVAFATGKPKIGHDPRRADTRRPRFRHRRGCYHAAKGFLLSAQRKAGPVSRCKRRPGFRAANRRPRSTQRTAGRVRAPAPPAQSCCWGEAGRGARRQARSRPSEGGRSPPPSCSS
jgi:hypothetical protein